jgi:bifunctional ADP-heptose synthase (sugar kinase/adenylyltransferase)
MKIIFLDHDGVICLGSEFGSRFKKQKRSVAETVGIKDLPIEDRFDNFNNKAIKVLNEILEKTGAEIVVSSDWKRWANLEELGEFYELQGIIKKPIALTPKLSDFDEYSDALFHYKGWYERARILEIEHWLKNNQVDSWVAVDDMQLGEYINVDGATNGGLKNFVHTPRLYEGIKQSGVKEKIISFLNS